MEWTRFSAGLLSWGPKLCNCIHFSCCKQKCAETLQVQLRFWSLMKSQSRVWFFCIFIYCNWHIAGVLFLIPIERQLNHRYCVINSMHTWEYICKNRICLASCYKYNLKDLEKMNIWFRWIISDAIVPICLMVLYSMYLYHDCCHCLLAFQTWTYFKVLYNSVNSLPFTELLFVN